jgi:23S rRNA pseudouridine2605 synthase
MTIVSRHIQNTLLRERMTDKTYPPKRGGPSGRGPSKYPSKEGAKGGFKRPPSGDDRPRRPRADDEARPQRSEGARTDGDRPRPPFRPREDRPQGDRPYGDRPRPPFRPREDRPQSDRPYGDRPRSPFRPREDRPQGDRPYGDRPRPPFRPREDRPQGDRPYGDRPRPPFRPREDRPYGDRPRFEDRPRFDKPREERPRFNNAVEGVEPGTPLEGEGERIAKAMARAGFASRRDAEIMISQSRVSVNGNVLSTPAFLVKAGDVIAVDGVPIPVKEKTRLWLYNKASGLVTTDSDPEGRPTVFSALPEGLPRVVSVGRLDINTEGLLLLTNDGGLARVLEMPATGWLRRYRVRAWGEVAPAALEALADGITIDDIHYGAVEARIDRVQGDNTWLTFGIREGKNREVKRILEHLGLQVNRLIRISFGPFQLGEMEEGQVEEVKTRILKDQLGIDLARQAGVEFDLLLREGEAPEPRRAPQQERRPSADRPERSGGDRPSFRPREDRAYGDRPREDRPPRFEGRDDRPRRDDSRGDSRGERSPRVPSSDARPARPDRFAVKKSVWRQDTPTSEQDGFKSRKPFRGDDPKKARFDSADRTHKRAGSIETPDGRAVKVEKVISEKPLITRERRDETQDRDRAPRREFNTDRPRPPFRPQEDRPQGDRPRGDRPYGDRPRPPFRPREDRPQGDKPQGDRPYGDRPRPPFRPREDRPQGDRPYGDRPRPPFRPQGDRPQGDRPYGDKPQGDRPRPPFRPREDRPQGDRPYGDRPYGERNNKPRSGGYGERSRGSRDDFQPQNAGDDYKPAPTNLEGRARFNQKLRSAETSVSEPKDKGE